MANISTVSNRFNNSTVAQFTHNGEWDVELITNLASPQFFPVILATQLQIQHRVFDKPMWKLNSNGNFTLFCTWNIIREQKNQTKLNNYTSHRSISSKCFFLLWRALRKKLPTNEKLISFGQDPHKCYCCYNLGMDTIEHIFVNRHFSYNVWKCFAALCGMDYSVVPLS